MEKIIAEIYFYFDKKTEKTKPKQSIFKKNKRWRISYVFCSTNFIMPYRNWQVLKKKRRYKVSKEIGCFSDVHSQTKFDLINNWMKYAIHSEYWRKILEKYDGVMMRKKTNLYLKRMHKKQNLKANMSLKLTSNRKK